MKTENFFTPQDFQSLDLFKSGKSKRGRPSEDKIVKCIRVKAWYQYLANERGAVSSTELGELFDVEDSNLFKKYRDGKHLPDKYVKMAERLVPGSMQILNKGPRGLFTAMSGGADECWTIASVYEDDGTPFVGRDVPLDLSISRLTEMVAGEMESGTQHDFAQFVQLVALFRIQCEAAKWVCVEQEGLYELICTMLDSAPYVERVLRLFDITKEFLNWAADLQTQRVLVDQGWRLAFDKWSGCEDEAPISLYLASPLLFSAASLELRLRHPYLAVMPNTLSSLATKSSARR